MNQGENDSLIHRGGQSQFRIASQGGTNFIAGAYLIMSMDLEIPIPGRSIAPARSVLGDSMIGKIVNQEGRWHDPVLDYYKTDLPNNAGRGEARDHVFTALLVVAPDILKGSESTVNRTTGLSLLISPDSTTSVWSGIRPIYHQLEHRTDAPF
jgi:hypothetical protein